MKLSEDSWDRDGAGVRADTKLVLLVSKAADKLTALIKAKFLI